MNDDFPADFSGSDTLVGMQAVKLEEPLDDTIENSSAQLEPLTRPRRPNEPAFLPEPPQSIKASGLSSSYLEELVLKHLFHSGDLRGSQISQRICLPAKIVEVILESLRKGKLIDIKGSGGTGLGRSQMIFSMTEAGHTLCQHSMERDRYIGPAPVPSAYYIQAVEAHLGMPT